MRGRSILALLLHAVLPAAAADSEFCSPLPVLVLYTDHSDTIDEPRPTAEWMTRGPMPMHAYAPDSCMADTAEGLTYNDTVGVKLRGRSTLQLIKHQYSLKLASKAPLLGLAAGKSFVLNGPFIDLTYLRNVLSYKLARSGMRQWQPHTRFLELFIAPAGQAAAAYPEDYKGLYVLIEAIKPESNRLSLGKLTPEAKTMPAVSGGYIFARDSPDPKDTKLETDGGVLVVKYPKPNSMIREQHDYLQWLLAMLDNAMGGFRCTLPVHHSKCHSRGGVLGKEEDTTAWRRYLHQPSFVDYMLHTEITKNQDGYATSRFFHKPRDHGANEHDYHQDDHDDEDQEERAGRGADAADDADYDDVDYDDADDDVDYDDGVRPGFRKIRAGPVWDFNLALGQIKEKQSPDGWLYQHKRDVIYTKLLQSAAFARAVAVRYHELRRGPWTDDTITAYLHTQMETIGASGAVTRDHTKWYGKQSTTARWHEWNHACKFMEQFLVSRLAWLDDHICSLIPDSPAAPALGPVGDGAQCIGGHFVCGRCECMRHWSGDNCEVEEDRAVQAVVVLPADANQNATDTDWGVNTTRKIRWRTNGDIPFVNVLVYVEDTDDIILNVTRRNDGRARLRLQWPGGEHLDQLLHPRPPRVLVMVQDPRDESVTNTSAPLDVSLPDSEDSEELEALGPNISTQAPEGPRAMRLVRLVLKYPMMQLVVLPSSHA